MLGLILTYAYPLMVPLSLVEGPMVALAGGALAATGRIDPFLVWAIVMAGGLFQDVLFYWLGRRAAQSRRVRDFIERAKLIRRALGPLHEAWRTQMFATLLAAKFAYGLYGPILVSAGMARAPFWRYLAESLLLSAVVLAGWLAAGYGLARAYGQLGPAADAVMALLGLVGIGGLVLIARFARRRLDSPPAR